MIDVTVTACGRPDLLARTLDSFLSTFDLPIRKIFVFEDSGIEGINDEIKKLLPNVVFIEPGKRFGQIKALDELISRVETEYYMALEDDWLFDQPGYGKASLDVLTSVDRISEVWLRYPNERNGHPCLGVIQKAQNGTRYQYLKTHYRNVWHGTSFACSLRRLSDYKRIFPNGYSDVCEFDPKNPLKSEQLIGREYMRAGMKAATLTTGHIRHLGLGRHIQLPL